MTAQGRAAGRFQHRCPAASATAGEPPPLGAGRAAAMAAEQSAVSAARPPPVVPLLPRGRDGAALRAVPLGAAGAPSEAAVEHFLKAGRLAARDGAEIRWWHAANSRRRAREAARSKCRPEGGRALGWGGSALTRAAVQIGAWGLWCVQTECEPAACLEPRGPAVPGEHRAQRCKGCATVLCVVRPHLQHCVRAGSVRRTKNCQRVPKGGLQAWRRVCRGERVRSA